MTLNKNAARAMFEEYLDDYGPDQRFENDIGARSFWLRAQAAKERIPHEDQTSFRGD